MELNFCPACGSPVVMGKEAKYCEVCGMDLYPIKKAMKNLRSRGTTISEQMEQLVAPTISKDETEEEKAEKILAFTDGDYAGKAIQLFKGKNVKQDKDFAMECLKEGVRVGNPEAELLMAAIEIEGRYGLEKNPKHAQKLLFKLAQDNNMEAQYLLGDLLGECSWFKKAAMQGHVESMYRLGRYYAHKDRLNSADVKLAEEWLQKAISYQHYDAAYELANMCYEKQYYFNEHKASDAFRYAKLAAEHDHKKAQQLLSKFYREGFGCKVDYDQCDYWRDRSYDSL